MKFIQPYLLILFLSPIALLGQESLRLFNDLPATSLVEASEFNVASKYNIYVDETMNLLLIRDEKKNLQTGQMDFVQLMHEIPIDHLSKSSFIMEHDADLNELRLKIKLHNNVPQIHTYWMSEGEIVSIVCLSKLGLGPWKYSEDLEKKLKLMADDLRKNYGRVTTQEENPYEFGKAVYKYGNKRATMIGKKQLDGKLNNNYYFPYAITTPPQFKKQKDLKLVEQAIKKSIKKQLSIKAGALSGTPVFVYLDENGKQESIFIAAKGKFNQKEKINLDEFISGGKNNGIAVKCKFVILF